MNKIFANLLCAFIPINKWRRKARSHLQLITDSNKFISLYKDDEIKIKKSEKRIEKNISLSKEFKAIFPKNLKIQDNASFYDFSKRNENEFKSWIKGKSVAIVGSSPIELNKNKGIEIDSHDIVIRMNNFDCSGVENDYGKKCNVWLRNSSPFHITLLREVSDFEYSIFNLNFERENPSDAILLLSKFFIKNNYKFFYFGKIIDEIALEVNNNLTNRASVGLIMVYFFYKLNQLENVNCYGFGFTDQLEKGVKQHYFEGNTHKDPAKTSHLWHNEKHFYQQMIKNKR